MAVPTDMDGFNDKIGTTDTYSRLSLGDALLNYLGNNLNSIECSDIGQFIDKLVPWLTCSNFKVSQKGLEIMTALAERMKNDFKPYVPTVCPTIVDRLGDSHEIVREKAQALLMVFLEKDVLTPQQLFDRVTYSFSHKNSKVREEIMICLVNTINMYGSNAIALSKLTPHLVKLLADQNIHVREQAFSTLMEIYRRVGDRLRMDIQRKYASTINPSRLAPLMAKMDELRESGAIATTITDGGSRYEGDGFKTIERKVAKPLHAKKPPSASLSSTPIAPAGAVDEEFFVNAFEDVPTIQIFSNHELKETINAIATTIGNPEMDWDKRVDAFKRIRSLLIAGAAGYEDFNELIKKWELPFVESLKDLRSHVVRETCVTIAYLAQNLGIKFGRFAEVLFQNLINLIQSSAKVMQSAAYTSIRFIIQNVHNQRLLPIINNNLTSRSREIRKAMCEVLDQLLHTWPLSILDKRIPLLQEAVKRGVSDADMEARISARRAYWAFKGYFPDQADALLATLDYAYKKNLYGDVSLSGSNHSLNQGSLTRQVSAPVRARIPSSSTERSLSLEDKHAEKVMKLTVRDADSKDDLKDTHLGKIKNRSSESLRRSSSSSLVYESRISVESQKRKRIKTGKHSWEVEKRKAICRALNWPQTAPDEMVVVGEPGSHTKTPFALFDVCVHKSSPSLPLVGNRVGSTLEWKCCWAAMGDVSSRNDVFQEAVGNFWLPPSPAESHDLIPVQHALKKVAKFIDNKIDEKIKSHCLEKCYPEIMGNRRLDKIRWANSSGQRRHENTRDAETMTILTGLPILPEKLDSFGNSVEDQDQNHLKKCPKNTNLYGKKHAEKENEKESLITKWRGAPNDASDSSKSLIFLFKSKFWCFDGDSDCEEAGDTLIHHQTILLI